ncbi:MAG: DNA repair protein RadA/Sms [Candidatus Deianiraeaceae bacterium]|jgi:DNA repair protein RadA/Sms
MRYHCIECGASYQKWVGKCSFCDNWNTVVENNADIKVMNSIGKKVSKKSRNVSVEFTNIKDIVKEEGVQRLQFTFAEINRVLGGGLMPASAVLIGGEPGIGKSTLLLQIAHDTSLQGSPVLYISGEESAFQIKDRANRIAKNCDINLMNVTDLQSILSAIKLLENKNAVVIIDSIQTVYMEEIAAGVGSIAQVRACSNEIITLAKKSGVSVFLIGHINKEGQIAGPKILEHMVDVVLYFEADDTGEYRILKSTKNRFGNVGEMGIFKMLESGLAEVLNPSELFLNKEKSSRIGVAVVAGMEGTRPMLLTVEALAVKSYGPMPRRNVVGYDVNRLSMVLAVLSVHLKLKLYDQDIHLNIAGGMKISEPAMDLAVAFAIYSSLQEKPIPYGVVFIGEIGLSGEVRPARFMDMRIKEAKKLGFSKIICTSLAKEEGAVAIKSIEEIPKIWAKL